jgi:predicted aspartyl protease
MRLSHFHKTVICIIPLFLSSCSPILNIIGNKFIDSHYAPERQKSLFYTEMPYVIEDGFIMIKAKVNNSEKEYNFIFDTGATTMIPDTLISELGLKKGITMVSKDANNHDVVGSSFLTRLKIGDLNIDNIRINTSTSDIFSKKCHQKIDGIIGPNVLNQGYFYFNPSQRKLIITNQKNKLPLEKFDKPTRIKRSMGQPFIKVKGVGAEWLKLDTGYADGFIFVNDNSKILSKKDMSFKQKYYPIKGLSSEEMKTMSYYNRKVKIGTTEFLIPIIKFSRTGGKGNIGSKIIQDNDVIIDRLNKKFYLYKIHNSSIDSISNVNFRFKNNNIIVGALAKNSTIEKMGLQINDTIYKINNISVSDIKSECELDDFKKKYIQNVFPLLIETEKNNSLKIFTITKKEFYE